MSILIALLSLAETGANGYDPAPKCSVTDRPVATKVHDLPREVLASLTQRMADAGAPFHVTDSVLAGEETWPFMRLICGYATRSGYVVEREIGGRGYHTGKFVFEKTSAGLKLQLLDHRF